MANDMGVRVELWPLAADDIGIWHLPGVDPWRMATNVQADSTTHHEVDLMLASHGAEDASVIHQTSCRVDGPTFWCTYVAVIPTGGRAVLDLWPLAVGVTDEARKIAGPPIPHGAADPPTPRTFDVLWHALRHLAWLRDTDAPTSAALDDVWLRHLEPLVPALAGMYQHDVDVAA